MIDIVLHIDFDADTYLREIQGFSDTYNRLISLSDTRRTKIGGRKQVSKGYVREFKKLLGEELSVIGLNIVNDLIDGTGGTTGNMASAWTLSFDGGADAEYGYLSNNPRKYLDIWRATHLTLDAEPFVNYGRNIASNNVNTGELTSSSLSDYTIHICNYARVNTKTFNNFTIGTDEFYAQQAITGGLGMVETTIDDPYAYAEQEFKRQFNNAVKRIKYALSKRRFKVV